MPRPVVVLVCLVLTGLVALALIGRNPGGLAVRPEPNLLRLEIPEGVGVVAEHHAKGVVVADDAWILHAQPLDPDAARAGIDVYRGMAPGKSAMQIDEMEGSDGSHIHRIARVADGGEVETLQYFISFDGEWVNLFVTPRAIEEPLDATRVDGLVRGLRMGREPRPEAERPPASEAYRRSRRPGDPVAKLVLYMDPAPVLLGEPGAVEADWSTFSDEDFDRGGRSIRPELIEFYTKDDPTSVRVDVLLEEGPPAAPSELVFEAPLRLADGTLALVCFDRVEPDVARVPPGRYRVRIWVVNRGVESERSLTDGERFTRDDLERYEIRLSPPGP